MASSVTLATLVADARSYADQINSEFRTDTQIERLVNLKLAKLYDLLIAARGQDYYITDDTLSITAAAGSEYSLASDFYQLKHVVLEWGSNQQETVRAVNSVAQRIRLLNADDWAQWSRKGYRLRGTTIEFLPTPRSSVTCRYQYIPAFTFLTNDTPGTTDVFDGINGWEELVTLGVAMDLMEMEEAGSGQRWAPQYAEQYERIAALAADRDADTPMQIQDVNPDCMGGSSLNSASYSGVDVFDGFYGEEYS